jgi:hypothetical protein
MAIKGKARRRARSKGVHSPPKPLITPKRIPFLSRRDVRRTLAVVLGLVVMLGGVRVWQNSARADSLGDYLAALKKAEGPYTAHLGAASPTAIDKTVQDFTQAKIGVAALLKLADQWEKDFAKARDNIRALNPPKQTAAAETWMLEGFDGLIAAARLFNVAGQQRQFADLPAQSKVQAKLEDQVQVVLLHANQMLTRARATLQRGLNVLDSYLKSWHVSDVPVTIP